MTTEIKSQITLKIPQQIYVVGGCFLAANICILMLNLGAALSVSIYTTCFFIFYFGVFKFYGFGRVLITCALLTTFIWNLLDISKIFISEHQIVSAENQTLIAYFGTFISLAAFFYLYSRHSRQWFSNLQLNLHNSRMKKRIRKLPKYTTEDTKNFLEIQKKIPPSYRWGRWIFLIFVVIDSLTIIYNFINGSDTIPRYNLKLMVVFSFDVIALIGLFKLSSRLLDLYTTFLYLCLTPLIFILVTLLILVVKDGIPNTDQAIHSTYILMLLLVGVFLKLSVILNKKSRNWLKAKRVLAGYVV